MRACDGLLRRVVVVVVVVMRLRLRAPVRLAARRLRGFAIRPVVIFI